MEEVEKSKLYYEEIVITMSPNGKGTAWGQDK